MLIYIMAATTGMRRNEIDKCKLSWFDKKADSVDIHIPEFEEVDGFHTKNHTSRTVSVTLEVYTGILNLREKVIKEHLSRQSKTPRKGKKCLRRDINNQSAEQRLRKQIYLIPTFTHQGTKITNETIRLPKHYRNLNKFLRQNGIDTQKPLHTVRKEYGSIVAEKYGIYHAQQNLGHKSVTTTEQYYIDRSGSPVIDVDMGGLI